MLAQGRNRPLTSTQGYSPAQGSSFSFSSLTLFCWQKPLPPRLKALYKPLVCYPPGLSLPPSLGPRVWFRGVLPSPSCGCAAGLQSLTTSPILLWESGEDTHHGSAFLGTRGLSHICSSTFMLIPRVQGAWP